MRNKVAHVGSKQTPAFTWTAINPGEHAIRIKRDVMERAMLQQYQNRKKNNCLSYESFQTIDEWRSISRKPIGRQFRNRNNFTILS